MEWINVNDYLPEEGKKVLGTMYKGAESPFYENYDLGKYTFRKGCFWIENDSEPFPIKFWMPLPEPPKKYIK